MQKTLILDGGMGQELVARSVRELTPLWATKILLEEPDLVQSVHDDYFAAGADIATTNTYTTHRDRLRPFGLEDRFTDLLVSACEIANRARDKHGQGMIAGSLGPNAKSYRPDLVLSLEEGAEVYGEMARIQAPFVDVFLLETMVSTQQAAGALMGASTCGKPVWVSVTVNDDDGGLLRSGEAVSDIVATALHYGAAAVLVNCSIPEAVTQALHRLSGQGVVLGAYANGFTRITEDFKDVNATVDQLETRTDLNPATYLDFARKWHEAGAEIIGGCCEVGPAHIRALAHHFKA